MSEKRVAVLLADGFEEGEALFTVDLLRRCGIHVDSISIKKDYLVNGAHGVKAAADLLLGDLTDANRDAYDMVVIPGGLPGATNLRDDPEVIRWVKKFNEEGKYVAAICAGPIVLERAGVIKGKRVTSYPSDAYQKLFTDAGATYINDELVVSDDNVVTSRGPATVFEFAFRIAEVLGVDPEPVKEGTLYNMLCDALENRL